MTENVNSTNNAKSVPLIVHGEWVGLQKWLSREQLGRLFLAVLNYGTGQEPDFSDDERLAMVWEMTIFPSLKSAREKYLDACKKNAAAGRKSAESRKRATTVNGRQHSLTTVNARQRSSTNSKDNNKGNFNNKKGDIVHDNQDAGDSSNCNGNPGPGGLPVGSPPPPVSFKQWTSEDFIESVDKAIDENPALAEHREPFLDYFLKNLTACGKPRFQAEKAWDTAARLRNWASRSWNGKQASPSQPASEQPALSDYERAVQAQAARQARFQAQLAAEAAVEKEVADVD